MNEMSDELDQVFCKHGQWWHYNVSAYSSSITLRSLWESTWGILESDIEYVVSNLHLNDRWMNFLILKLHSDKKNLCFYSIAS